MGDFQGDSERFSEIFPHQRERDKNAVKQIVYIDNQGITHKKPRFPIIGPRRGRMQEKRG